LGENLDPIFQKCVVVEGVRGEVSCVLLVRESAGGLELSLEWLVIVDVRQGALVAVRGSAEVWWT